MGNQSLKQQLIRAKYSLKRKKSDWEERKKLHIYQRLIYISRIRDRQKKKEIDIVAPSNFSFVSNTEEVLWFFNLIKIQLENGYPVKIDISKITNLTSDVIVLLIAIIKDKRSMKVGISGNAPENPELKKLFIESGLYNFVNSKGKKRVATINKLWRHSTNNQVRGEIAGEAISVCKKVFLDRGVVYDADDIYNLLVEAMSNTINHANKKKNINWWLYYYIDEQEKVIRYSFVDLGVGIFKSATFQSYVAKFNWILPGNNYLVKPFLEGKIISSRETDKQISGKGVKQILDCANKSEFIGFTIITNDQIINVKDQNSQSLNSNFDGTFIHFEISYST
ncbi:MAG: hypothetical protein RL284_440 [Bacteroidota bacterium]|jgi:hypothetical protein